MPTSPLPPAAERRAALLFTDIVESTRIHAEIGDAAARRIWAAHDTAARVLARAWRGREIGRSDGFLLMFDAADDALGYALAYHAMTAALEVPLAARAGVHWGEVVLRDNAATDVAAGATPFEVDGLCLPVAARILSAAHGGQTLLSAEAAAALRDPAAHGARRHTHGHWRLKGVPLPVELIEFAPPQAASIPPPDSAKAYRVVEREGLWVPVAQLPHNLGAEPDRFVGREDALHAIAAAFDDDDDDRAEGDAAARLVTLLGIGGMGKTRLAQRYARGWLGSHPGGAWFCDLSAAQSVDGIAHAVAQALDVPLGRADPVQQLATVLAGRGDCLVVLDNFEQVARHAAATVGVWLNAVPAAKFLVTSREVLGLPGEQVQVLAPLSGAEAQAMFRQHMLAAGLRERLADDDAAALPQLVELLDRLPLAIELAAARARTVPPADQVKRMGERFRLLVGRSGRRDRQATLRATLDWSWELLTAHEQSALAQLSVFERGFTLEAAEAVVQVDPSDRDIPWVVDLIQSLLEKSLLRRIHPRRFDLLRTVQDYAAEQLSSLDRTGGAVQRHCRHFAGIDSHAAIADGCSELDNLVVACRRATDAATRDLSPVIEGSLAVDALANVWAALRLTGPFRTAIELATPLSRLDDLPTRHRIQANRILGSATLLLGDLKQSEEVFERAIQLARDVSDPVLRARLRCWVADLHTRSGRHDEAASALVEALALNPDDLETRVMALNALGSLALADSKLGEGRHHFERALAAARTLGDPRWIGGLHGNIGTVDMLQGRLLDARPHLEEAVSIARLLRDRQWEGNAHCNLGLLLHETGDLEGAIRELVRALELARSIGHRRLEATALCNLGIVNTAQEDFASAHRLMSQAIDIADALGDARLRGRLLGYSAVAAAGRLENSTAKAELDTAERLLRVAHDEAALALLACQTVGILWRAGECLPAAAALETAAERVSALGDSADAELLRALRSAREIVESVSPAC